MLGGKLKVPVAIVLSLVSTLKGEEPSVHKRPNLLFIMADDHTTQAIGAYGGHLAKLNPTPNIDGLAKGGMRFERVFCHNAICTPSRATILTGQYSQTNGVLDLQGRLAPARQFLPIELGKAGYQTAMIGKWHLKEEPSTFDYYCVLPGQGKYHDPDFRIRGEKKWPGNVIRKKGKHSSDAITDLGLEWLQNGRDKSKPFFLMHHFKAPHDMFSHAKRYSEWLESEEIPEPDNLFDRPNGSKASRGMGSGVRKDAPWFLGRRLGISPDLKEPAYSKACYQEYLKRYLRCVKGVDDNVKRLIDYLRECGELENTVIVYTGDQGFFLGEHDLMDKRWMYEEAMRMPFIVHWPKKVKSGSVNDWLINNTDFAPTFLELAGAKKPMAMQGMSFADALEGKPKPSGWREVTYYRYWMHLAHRLAVPAHFGVRSDRYKLIFFYGVTPEGGQPTPAAWEFYDLEKDPHEMKNRYDDPDYEEVIKRMKVQLRRVRGELNETDTKYPAVRKIIEAHWDQ
jgi:arylsulfatase A-like enzyme